MLNNIVPPSGPIDSKIVILGEAPGVEECKQLKNFVGQTGRVLFSDHLARAGIDQSDCLTMNTYWESPPGGRWQLVKDSWKYEDQCRDVINSHPRDLIIAVGDMALNMLTGKQKITKWRGSILRSNFWGDNCAILPIIHPSAWMRKKKDDEKKGEGVGYWARVLGRYDGLRAKEILINPGLCDIEREVTTYASLSLKCGQGQEDVFDGFRDALQIYKEAPCLSFDIETDPKRGVITCIGLARSESSSIVVPLGLELKSSQQKELIKDIRDILRGDALKIAQNSDFDCQWLAREFGINVKNLWMDTMIAHAVLHPDMDHDLDLLTSIYTLHPFYAEDKSISAEEFWKYCGTDCMVTFEVANKLYTELKEGGLWDFFNTLSMPVTKTLIRMEKRGVLIDQEERGKLFKEAEENVKRLESTGNLGGINCKSSQQVLKFLAGYNAVPKLKGKVTTGVNALKLLKNKRKDIAHLIDEIIEVRQQRDLNSKFLKPMEHEDGRRRCQYKTSSTSSGRISSTADVFNKGTNFQNQPKRVRSIFKADSGRIFWACDSSQIEARITAYVSGDRNYISGYQEERDLYVETALAVFGNLGVTKKSVRSIIPGCEYLETTYRDVGKTIRLAMGYVSGPRTIQNQVNVKAPTLPFTFADAKRAKQSFEEMHPGVVKWWERIVRQVRATHILWTPTGRRKVFLGRDDTREMYTELTRSAISFIPQGTAADHINAALIRVERRFEDVEGAEVLLQTHDEIAGQCLPGDIDRVREIVVEEMEKPIPLKYKGIPLVVPAEFVSGETWRDCK